MEERGLVAHRTEGRAMLMGGSRRGRRCLLRAGPGGGRHGSGWAACCGCWDGPGSIDDGETVVLVSPAGPDGLPARETVAGTGSPASAGPSRGAVNKSFLLFITATQTDPAGNPVHTGGRWWRNG